MCKNKKVIEEVSLFDDIKAPSALYTAFPFLALFAGLLCFFVFSPSCLSLLSGLCLCIYAIVIFYLRIENKIKNIK